MGRMAKVEPELGPNDYPHALCLKANKANTYLVIELKRPGVSASPDAKLLMCIINFD